MKLGTIFTTKVPYPLASTKNSFIINNFVIEIKNSIMKTVIKKILSNFNYQYINIINTI